MVNFVQIPNLPAAIGLSGAELFEGVQGGVSVKISANQLKTFIGSTPSSGVTTFSGGSTGLTPAAATSGAVALAGVLVATSGGTGLASYAVGDLLYASSASVLSRLAVGANGTVLTLAAGVPTWAAVGGTGTVTTVSVVGANGFAGSVANPTTTPAITISTSITGILQGNGTAISAASTTGSGAIALATSPVLVTPALGTPSSGVLTNATGLPIGTGVSGLAAGVATFLGTPSSANLAAALTDKTGTGVNVFATSPTLVTPVLGTPTSVTLTNATGLPIGTGVSGLAAGIATFLGAPSSANLAAALTDKTGTGANVFATSPVLVTPALGTPSSGVLTNTTGLPIGTGVSGLGTGVATALGVNVGSAGAFVTFNGALGTPSSGTLTSATGLPISTGVSGLAANMATWLAAPSSANLAATVTDETGTGALVFASTPTLVTPLLGTPTSGNLSNCTVDGTNAVGFRQIPQNSQSAAYTTVLADGGKHLYHPSADTTARTWTIDSNANVAYPIGTAITFVNDTSGGVITIAITTDTLVLAGAGTTGSRSLAANGVATAIKMTSTRWIISGTGLT